MKIVLLCLANAFALTFAGDVVDVDDSSFGTVLGGVPIAFVDFYSPGCPHCQMLEPEFDAAAAALKRNGPPVVFARVDCSGHGKNSCLSQGVKGYPTLKVFRDGQFAASYRGPRTANDMVKYINQLEQ